MPVGANFPIVMEFVMEFVMGRFRNPRYAPELLERRLSPSTSVVCPTTAYVGSYSSGTSGPAEPPPPPYPCPTDPLAPPVGPTVPA